MTYDIPFFFSLYVTHNRESYAPKKRIKRERRAIYEYGKDKNGDCHWKPHTAQQIMPLILFGRVVGFVIYKRIPKVLPILLN